MWHSLYLYPKEEIDEYCRLRLKGLLRATVDEGKPSDHYFFVRYVDAIGAHVRIRVRGSESWERLTRALGVETRGPTPRRIYRADAGSIRFVRYRPEVNRYGGRKRLLLCESHFASSSAWVTRHALHEPYGLRLKISAMCSILLMSGFSLNGDQQAILWRLFARSHLCRLAACGVHEVEATILQQLVGTGGAWGALLRCSEKCAADAPGIWRQWQDMNRDLFSCLRPFERDNNSPVYRSINILFSILHMHNNRLGVSPFDEALISLGIQRAHKCLR